MADEGRRIVVLAPDVVVKSFVVAECRDVLNRWRDGAIVPVVTRDLLVYYLRGLRGAGLPDEHLRRWAAWFTAREKARYIAQPGSAPTSQREILLEAAVRGNATCIITAGPAVDSPGTPVPMIGAAEFLMGERR